ncbi:hypothetical protein EJ02DRAFT_456983 [Clathrospora elynae]|uniref:Uncharacterized protein n=1 Tax=Clathrospora elynae TaxID=706981 RepID=A0A6A5SFG0_9PLEO|nr:hypothetical protein EJ02DRAFT_456983 [Clathrospora elynae]
MLAILSRARQNPGTCRCISCVSSANAVAGRGGRAALRGSWAFGTPTSTFVYTTIFAAGLAVDAKVKAARNKQWDQAFEHLREVMDSPTRGEGAKETEAASERRGQHCLTLEHLPSDLNWQAMHRIVGMELVDDHVLRKPEMPSQVYDVLEAAWDDLRFDSRFPGAQSLEWPANTGPDLVPYNLPPQSLWAPDTMRLTAMRRRHTWKKLALQELSTALLVHNLISRANLPRFSSTASFDLETLSPEIHKVSSLTEAQGQQARADILESIEKLHKTMVDSPAEDVVKARIHMDHPAIPRYFQDADGDFYGISKQMNEGIKRLLQQKPKGNDQSEALAILKICHNLLVSSASPDLQTFNILLAGFKRWRRPQLVDDVIASFYVNKIRPNEMTCREILGYYIFEKRPVDFSRFVARMRGVGDALMLANPNITVNEASHDRLIRISPDKIYQKVHPTPMVFDSLIGGVMTFAGFDRALDIYYELKADGWGLHVQGLTRLLSDCIRRADWEGAIYLWEEINSIKATAKPKDMAKAYYHMLSLCSITGNTVAFNQILNEVAKGGFDRKSILDAAIRTTRRAQKPKGYLAPAWAADNVMIAVSDYISDAKPSDFGAECGDEAMFEQNVPDTTEDTEAHMADTKVAWASWVEHEFGETPKDPKA